MQINYEKVKTFLESLNIKYHTDYPFSKCSSFRAGGNIGLYIIAEKEKSFFEIIKFFEDSNIEYILIGEGNNILVREEGYDGIVISLQGDFDSFVFEGNYLYASASVRLERLAHEARIRNLSGLEFVALLSHTVGSSVFNQIESFGNSIMTNIETIRVVEIRNREVLIDQYSKEEYSSLEKSLRKNLKILSVVFKLIDGDPKEIDKKIEWFKYIRGSIAPLESNIGPIFSDKDDLKIYEMVERVGALDIEIGSIKWYKRFPNYIINTQSDGNANANDAIKLIEDTKKKIEQHYQITPEVNIIVLGK